jgi:hypothetical protein
MKANKKQKKALPEVHILGDLQDVKKLVSGVNKKKTIVVFKDGDEGSIYLEIEGKFQQIQLKDLKYLEKEYKLIYFSFFPSRKKVEPAKVEKLKPAKVEKLKVKEVKAPVIPEPKPKAKKVKAEKPVRKVTKVKK